MKPKICKTALLSFILTNFFLMSPVDANCGPNCQYVTDSNDRRLGAQFASESNVKNGEVAIFTAPYQGQDVSVLVIVTCADQELKAPFGQARRLDRNCSNLRSIWPKNLIGFVADVKHVELVLTEPPIFCGACAETPFAEFDLPKGVQLHSRWNQSFGWQNLDLLDFKRNWFHAPQIPMD